MFKKRLQILSPVENQKTSLPCTLKQLSPKNKKLFMKNKKSKFNSLSNNIYDKVLSSKSPNKKEINYLNYEKQLKCTPSTSSLNEYKKVQRLKTVDGNFISCFFTKSYIFSNHFTRYDLIKIDGQKYICSEQYYMFYKARVFGDIKTAHRIMDANNPKTMKRIASFIKNFDLKKWRKVAIQVMVIASLCKFEQNADLRAELFETDGSTLVEASPGDKYWGVGLNMFDPLICLPQSWPGINILGQILTRVRIKLMARNEFKNEIKNQVNFIVIKNDQNLSPVKCKKKTLRQTSIKNVSPNSFVNSSNFSLNSSKLVPNFKLSLLMINISKYNIIKKVFIKN